jgi:2-polyprenyl-3-methyl-5-hydroxy-6-metoxy-1,4-benzoquinol methylase
MILERHDITETECNEERNSSYIKLYMDWITPHTHGRVCDLGSGFGYPTVGYANRHNVELILTNDKFFDEKKTLVHPKIVRRIESTEDFIKNDFGKFDCITCTEHIEHLEESVQHDVLNWIVKSLKDDGVFFGSMPDIERSSNQFHLKEYRSFQWEEILKRYFKQVEVHVLYPNSLYVWRASNMTS